MDEYCVSWAALPLVDSNADWRAKSDEERCIFLGAMMNFEAFGNAKL